MKRFKTWQIFFCLALLASPLGAQIILKSPLSPRNANYDLTVTLNTETKQIQGHEVLTWRNITSRPTRELQFHLYMNAFKNDKSTFMTESGSTGGILRRKNAWGWIDVTSLRLAGGGDLSGRISFIHPDDDNEKDQTVMRVTLPRLVDPGETIRLELNFTTQLPYVYRRNGYRKDFFMVSQWFPKVGVLENSGWNCHQFHANSEFFSDYGVYNVELTLPKQYIIGSTGVVQETKESDSLKTLRIRAEDVHDFAWTAWPQFLIAQREHRGVKIIHLYEEDQKGTVERTLDAMERTLDYLSDWVGEYPYPQITVMHPPTDCMNVGGMEYPMFVTGGSFYGLPKGIKATEMVTVHEFGHNWWYGMVGNNEFEEAWLDEGINSYSELRMMDEFYGSNESMIEVPGFRAGEIAYQRPSYIPVARWDRTLRPAWTYIGGGYGSHSYSKPALMLKTLENYIGREKMDQVMRSFFQRWKFHHPHSDDFIAEVNRVTGKDFNWFFDALLKGSEDVDYEVRYVRTGKDREDVGLFDEGGEKVLLPRKPDSSAVATPDSGATEPELYTSVVRVHRIGEFIIPMDILLVFENGDSLTTRWDGKERWFKYTVQRESKLAWAEVDPKHVLVLDKDFCNNSKTVSARKGPVNYITSRFLMFFETAMNVIGFMG